MRADAAYCVCVAPDETTTLWAPSPSNMVEQVDRTLSASPVADSSIARHPIPTQLKISHSTRVICYSSIHTPRFHHRVDRRRGGPAGRARRPACRRRRRGRARLSVCHVRRRSILGEDSRCARASERANTCQHANKYAATAIHAACHGTCSTAQYPRDRTGRQASNQRMPNLPGPDHALSG